MIPTPDLSHLKSKDYDLVYEPAEDTFLLLDALEAEADNLKAITPRICLEIGSGSGCVSAFVATILGPSTLYLSTDINPQACTFTKRTGAQNKVVIDVVHTSFARPLRKRLRHLVDIIIFNPPYVPTEDQEASYAQSNGDISGAWAGGKNGMDVTNIFLEHVEDLLSQKGCFFLVALKCNDVPNIQRIMLEKFGMKSKIVLQRKAGREQLFILHFSRLLTT